MKKTNLHSFFGVAVLALAGSIAAAGSAHAATYSDGDLLLGFRATGGSGTLTDYVIDIGPVSLYKNTSGSFALNTTAGAGSASGIGNIGLDLSSVFGANWATRSDLSWGIIGFTKSAAGGDTAYTEYASRATTPGVSATPWPRNSGSTQSASYSAFLGMVTDYKTWTNTANSPTGVIENHTTDATGNYWASYMPTADTVAFNLFDSSFEGNFGSGVSGTALDLFRMPTGSGDGTKVGQFTMSSSGVVTFTSANVPEPTSLAMLGLGTCFVGLVRRRRSVVA